MPPQAKRNAGAKPMSEDKKRLAVQHMSKMLIQSQREAGNTQITYEEAKKAAIRAAIRHDRKRDHN